MKAYVIAEMDVTDPVGIEEYRRRAGASVAAHNGRFIVRGGTIESLEGGWEPRRIVVIEFPSTAQARQWWSSKDYTAARELRAGMARARIILVEGVT